MKKLIFLLYAIICYGIFLAAFIYLIGFVENVSRFSFAAALSPLFYKTLDIGDTTLHLFPAIVVDLLLIALFGIQHSIMARSGFKQRWTKVIPPPIDRSTYVLITSIILIVLYYFWKPVTIAVWDLSTTVAGLIFFLISLAGWGLLLISTFLINHFDLFGLRQPYLYARNKEVGQLSFRTPALYRIIRHPIYFSFLIAFWFAPLMTVGHLIFSIGMTVYIFIGIYHEEKDLVEAFGLQYQNYRLSVPRIIPFTKRHSQQTSDVP